MITPNRLTLLRIVLALACPILILWQRTNAVEFLALVFFVFACLTDWWDGHLARSRSMVTSFGKIADPIADKLLILGFMGVFAFYGLYAAEWVIAIAIREVTVTIARLSRLARGEVLPAEWAGKLKVGFQIASVLLSICYLILLDSIFFSLHPATVEAVRFLHHLGIASAVFFTFLSGAIFFSRLDGEA